MGLFEQEKNQLFEKLQDHGNMVLSTSLHDRITSRMMSVIVKDQAFYFQTDRTFRKYGQLMRNPNAALCMDNIQIEGICEQIGAPKEQKLFCELFRKYFPSSYERYTNLEDERLFILRPVYIQRWIYEEGKPVTEIFDYEQERYVKEAYLGR